MFGQRERGSIMQKKNKIINLNMEMPTSIKHLLAATKKAAIAIQRASNEERQSFFQTLSRKL